MDKLRLSDLNDLRTWVDQMYWDFDRLSRSGQESFRLTPTAARLPKTLQIAGGSSATINGTNFSNIPLLISMQYYTYIWG